MAKEKCVYAVVSAFLLLFTTLVGPAFGSEEPTLLTIEITESETGVASVTEMTFSDLSALPQTSFTTSTNWTNGDQTFTGVALPALLATLEVTDGQMELVAINDYRLFLETDDPTNQGAMIAYLLNGNTMTARDKGPLWMVYNYDSDPAYRTETIYSRSIWQLDRIVISR